MQECMGRSIRSDTGGRVGETSVRAEKVGS